MKRISADLIIFDLDGTLINSRKDIAVSLNETLTVMGLPSLSEETISSFVGNGVRPLLEKAVKESGRTDDLPIAIKHFRRIYPKRLLETTVMFEGVGEVLEHFMKNGKKMAIASNKPYRYIIMILDGLEMTRFFTSIKGGDSVNTQKPEPEMLNAIVKEIGASKGRTVFVGDSGVDILAGKNSEVKTVGVTYGFRPRDEVLGSFPDAVVERPIELKEIIK